jgi:hypothetical protein
MHINGLQAPVAALVLLEPFIIDLFHEFERFEAAVEWIMPAISLAYMHLRSHQKKTERLMSVDTSAREIAGSHYSHFLTN